ncbi:YpmS family protein [Pontibacillus litoralis]|uniref:DUF2140 family protein n=1 Tax=Pontibacillus litoralis JSM 072002 TaxID=1385512 RepID=A0A0A5G5A8_9BACI|nr:YpmS family protein [Pontibacillus litoralis]KGX87239.1 hypothetical protein N784_16535 [Pontibacillus litoralis JSM 072002]
MFKAIHLQNKWKILFWLLATCNIGILILLFILLYVPSSKTVIPKQAPIKEEQAEFIVMSTTDNINSIIQSYLNDLADEQPLEYSVKLKEAVELKGTIEAFDKKIPLTMKFNPIVQYNGDLILQPQSITLGRLKLPNKKVLDYIKDHYPMPHWVMVNPTDENIYVAITQIETKNDVNIKAETFHLQNEQIAFKVTIPHEALGIGEAPWLKKLFQSSRGKS